MKMRILLPLIASASLVIAPVSAVYAVNAKTEVQLQKLSPMVKSVSISLKGSELEREALQTIASMVDQMLDNSKIGTVNIPVNSNPSTLTDVPTLQRLNVVIQADAPDSKGSPYAVAVTIQDAENADASQLRSFAYYPNQQSLFYEQLHTFLTETLDLQPIS